MNAINLSSFKGSFHSKKVRVFIYEKYSNLYIVIFKESVFSSTSIGVINVCFFDTDVQDL